MGRDYTCDARANLAGRDRLSRLADFLFEAGMLRKTPRTGYQFLGTGQENVAEHSFRTAVIGFVLAEMAGANAERTAMLCLFHDLHEARTGDFNYRITSYNVCYTKLLREVAAVGGFKLGAGGQPFVLAGADVQHRIGRGEGHERVHVLGHVGAGHLVEQGAHLALCVGVHAAVVDRAGGQCWGA